MAMKKLNVIHIQKNETGFLFHIIYKINSKWNKDLNMRPKPIKLPGKAFDTGLGNNFGYDPKTQATKVKLDRTVCLILKALSQQRK